MRNVQIYARPYARKKIVQEYIVTFLTGQNVIRQKKGSAGLDGKTSHASINKVHKSLMDLWRRESAETWNPIGLHRAAADMAADENAVRLLTGDYAETNYALGPITDLLKAHLQNIKIIRNKENLEMYVERAFKSHLVDLDSTEYFRSVYACWAPEMIASAGRGTTQASAVLGALITGNVCVGVVL